ncbi:hypothetical protein [Streptomyces mirabilis]
MTRVPDAVAVASLDTHRLIVAVPNEGPADIATNYPRQTAADVLRQLADGLDSPVGLCATARATGRPCPTHDAPAPPSSVLLATSPAEDLARGIRQAQRPDGLDRLLAVGLVGMRTPAERAVDEARQCLAFNAGEPSPALAARRPRRPPRRAGAAVSAAQQLAADVLVATATVIAAGAPLGWWAARRDPGPLAGRDRASRRARAGAQADRDLLRLARNANRRKEKTP